jgi:hypothetical protein
MQPSMRRLRRLACVAGHPDQGRSAFLSEMAGTSPAMTLQKPPLAIRRE